MDFAWNLTTAPALAAVPVESWGIEIGTSLRKAQTPLPAMRTQRAWVVPSEKLVTSDFAARVIHRVRSRWDSPIPTAMIPSSDPLAADNAVAAALTTQHFREVPKIDRQRRTQEMVLVSDSMHAFTEHAPHRSESLSRPSR